MSGGQVYCINNGFVTKTTTKIIGCKGIRVHYNLFWKVLLVIIIWVIIVVIIILTNIADHFIWHRSSFDSVVDVIVVHNITLVCNTAQENMTEHYFGLWDHKNGGKSWHFIGYYMSHVWDHLKAAWGKAFL